MNSTLQQVCVWGEKHSMHGAGAVLRFGPLRGLGKHALQTPADGPGLFPL